jgi:hypothetical protein
MEDLIEQANEIQESLGRSYGVPDEVDEADLQAGTSSHCAARGISPQRCRWWNPQQAGGLAAEIDETLMIYRIGCARLGR